MRKREGNNGNHGAKGRSGRKPKAITLLKRSLIETGKEDAEYAYSLFVSIMHDDKVDLGLRKDCAREVLDRVLGKSKEHRELTGANGGPIQTEDVGLTDTERVARLAALFERARQARDRQPTGGAGKT